MSSIYISGIPKGLDRETVTQRIRRDIETVAQVRKIWIQNEKGYGFVSLEDETSVNFVLSLNGRICINGNALRLTRRTRTISKPKTPRQTDAPTCKQQVNNNVFYLRGYDTYTDYRCHRPQIDVIYQYTEQAPKLKKKPWKNVNRVSQLTSPKSRKIVRAKRRKGRKKNTRRTKIMQSTSPSEVTLHSVSKREKRCQLNLENVPTSLSRNDSTLTSALKSSSKPGNINEKLEASIVTRASATVHVYDHSKRLCSIEVDNNNVFESIQAGLNKEQLPSHGTILISHNGKTVTTQWQPTMANDDNIHIVVKGKGGMMQGDPPDGNDFGNDIKARETNDSSDVEINNINAEASCSEKSLNKSEQMDHRLDKETDRKPEDDKKKTNSSDLGSIARVGIDKAEQMDHRLDKETDRKPEDDKKKTNSSDLGSIARVGIDKAEQMDHRLDRETDRKPEDDKNKTNFSDLGSIAGVGIDQAEQLHHRLDKETDRKPEDDKKKTNSSDLGSFARVGIDKAAQVHQPRDHTHASVQESASSLFVSTFSHRSEDYQAKVISELHLGDYFPDQLTYETVMSVSDTEKDEADTLADLPRLILRKLIMLDFTSREKDFNICLTNMTRLRDDPPKKCQETSNSAISEDEFHSMFDDDEDIQKKSILNLDKRSPVDIFLSIFICLHPTLKQKVCLKMFACHLAIPIIFPVRKNEQQDNLAFSMWPLRSITVHDGKTDISIVNCKQNVVSLIRLGRPQLSKSKLANELLYDTCHNAFLHYDCILGSCKKKASVGLVEASWFLPSPKQPRKLQRVTAILNLRGDGLNNAEQTEYLKRVSHVMIIVTDRETLKNKKEMAYFKRAHLNVLFLLTGNVTTKFIRTYKQFYMNTCPDGFNADFISGSECGTNIGLSEVSEIILEKIGALLNDTTSAKTITEMCEQARTTGITVDEDMPTYKNGRFLAKRIFDGIKHCPLADIGVKFIPLQKDNWQKYTDAMKKHCKSGSVIQDQVNLEQIINSQRTNQWKAYLSGEPFIKDFIYTFLELDNNELVCFLEWLKFEIDEKSRRELTYYRKSYEDAWNKFQPTSGPDKDLAKKAVSKAEQQFIESSFGVEHMFRELGQIYEASLIANESVFGSKLAKAVARSITLGFSFELMDGEVANVPLNWVEQVFKELKHMLGDVRLLTLSILGLQSSGKSTLLNAMFGLTFSVSAGRCTRGIYVQLLPVKKSTLKFDYVLVVDTEGLRAPEMGVKKCKHDNELATLVLGMADLTIFNIKSENTSEVNDILQICVHAFLRLKMANHNLQLRQSCIFIHQNVSDVGARDSMIHARKRLDETLDKMALEAAEEENISDIKCFKDVIGFDSNKHVWYFSDLWTGDPPMAPVNPGYSRDVREVKSFIFKELLKHKQSYLTICETFVHIKDLWNGILANDFVFSFTNSLEIIAYNALDNVYQKLIWELEIVAKDIMSNGEVEMKQFVDYACDNVKINDDVIAQFTVKIRNKCLKDFRNGASVSRKKLCEYFEQNERKDEIVQWKDRKLLSLEMTTSYCCDKIKKQLNDMQTRCNVDYKLKTSLQKLKNEIYDKVKILAEDMKGAQLSYKDMETYFDKMWNGWIGHIDVQEEKPTDIPMLLESLLFDIFNTHKNIVDTELKANLLDSCKVFTTLENSLDDFYFGKKYVSVPTMWKKLTSCVMSPLRKPILQFTNGILKNMDVHFRNLEKTEWKFNATDIKIILKSIMERVDNHNRKENCEFKLHESYKVKVAVHVCVRVLPLLKRLDSDYKAKYCMKKKLKNFKDIIWRHFRDVMEKKSALITACDRFCEIVKDNVEEKVRNSMSELIHRYIVEDIGVTKTDLIIRVLEYLANEQKFNYYVEYIEDPYMFAFQWLKQHIDRKCFQSPTKLYAAVVTTEIQKTINVISESAQRNSASCIRDWLSDFLNEISHVISIPLESFYLVLDQNIENLDDFLAIVEEKLREISSLLKTKLQSETAKSIIWCNDETPYLKTAEKLWGCTAVCPFCHEPCKWNEHTDSQQHTCIQHRAQGVLGTSWKDTDQLALENCNYDVQSSASFRCGGRCTRDECHKSDKSEKYHPYREYKKYIQEWDIIPNPNSSSSKYWAWVLCTFNKKFAAHYGKKECEIPQQWKRFTKDDAVNSLREYQ